MKRKLIRPSLTLLFLFGAVLFGMVLAGGLNWTPLGNSSPQEGMPQSVPSFSQAPAAVPSFADLAEAVSPAVVRIEVVTFETQDPHRRSPDPFEFFFGPRRRPEQPEEEEPNEREFRSMSGGSGFVVSSDGLVVTNNHVIDGASKVTVHLGDRDYDAEVKGTDPDTDLALLKIDAGEAVPFLALGESSTLRPGDWVMAIGSPLRLTNTVTVGVVSAKGRRIGLNQESSFENFIQTDAAINFGNSGGPLINLQGEVVGINTAINFGSENIGFAVPVNTLVQILPQLRDTGHVKRGFLGIGVQDLSYEAVEAYGLDSTDGALILSVEPGLPADEAGLRPGDIILEVDDLVIQNTRELIDYVSGKGPGTVVSVRVLRGGENIEMPVTLAERAAEGTEAEEPEEEGEGEIDWLGVRYQDMSGSFKESHGLPEDVEGVWVSRISPRSPLSDEGVSAEGVLIVITEVNGESIDSVEAFEEKVGAAKSGSRLRLYIRRFANGQEVAPLFVFPSVP